MNYCWENKFVQKMLLKNLHAQKLWESQMTFDVAGVFSLLWVCQTINNMCDICLDPWTDQQWKSRLQSNPTRAWWATSQIVDIIFTFWNNTLSLLINTKISSCVFFPSPVLSHRVRHVCEDFLRVKQGEGIYKRLSVELSPASSRTLQREACGAAPIRRS